MENCALPKEVYLVTNVKQLLAKEKQSKTQFHVVLGTQRELPVLFIT